MSLWKPFTLSLLLGVSFAWADGPADNVVDSVRPVPPPGTKLADADKAEIEKGLKELQDIIKAIGKHDLLADVLIYEKGVRWALEFNEVYDGKGAKTTGVNVKKALQLGLERAKLMKEGKTPWTTATGPVLRAYKSKIDGSIQPYWINVPTTYKYYGKEKHRLDFWWRGRSETGSEANFVASPQGASGIIPAPGAFVLLPMGRYCCANKFAGEVDTFECLEHAKKFYRIDESRLVARGFSMGGAATWQYTVHFPGLFCASAPGAGFSETREFLKDFQGEVVKPTWYEKKLWRMYDCTEYSQNIFNIPTVAYSGEIDSQKQAADIMAREMKKVGLELTHIIGPKTGHSYEANAKKIVNEKIDAIVEKGLPAERKEIKFVTYTLRYNQCDRIRILGLAKHWNQARVDVHFNADKITLKTDNITEIEIYLTNERPVIIDGTALVIMLRDKEFGGCWRRFVKADSGWVSAQPKEETNLAKRHGLQGPIDDAFMDAFIMVKPTGSPLSDKIGDWTKKEMAHAQSHWRKQFRGDAPTKNDTAITDDDIKNNNLILWGDTSSNAILKKIADKLPIKDFGENTVQLLIYPNPLNPKKYVVLNSGFTFREYDYLNNARQISKLPDYAVIDVNTPANSRWPGKVIRAGFFDEKWQLQKNDGE